MRLVTRSDFDGLACGALLKEAGIIDSWKFAHPKDLQDGLVPVDENDCLANVPFVEGCGLWFDHHSSEHERNELKGKYKGESRITPSCARIIYEYYGGRERFPQFDDMMEAVDKVDSQKVANIVKGVANACKESGCALIGGETAEMAGFYSKGEYDIAGFCVGVVEKSKMITGDKVKAGDVLLGLPSSGVHSNGFSLVRKICFEAMGYTMDTEIPEFGCTLGEKLLTPTRLYPKTCLPLIENFDLHGMVHITGGGFYDNIPRILPEDCDAEVNAEAWEVPVVFKKLQEWGNVPWAEMYRTFNMGVGMVLVVDPSEADAVRAHLKAEGETFYELGKVVPGHKETIMKGGVFGA